MRNTTLELGNGDNILDYISLKADQSTTYTKKEVDNLISSVTASALNSARKVANIAARDALVDKYGFVWVVDASGDTTVTSGSALYLWDSENSTWLKCTEAESMDLVVDWTDVQNKPDTITYLGNVTNAANGLVKLTASGTYPALSGASITNLNGTNIKSGTVGAAYLVKATNTTAGIASFPATYFTVSGSGEVSVNTASASGYGVVKIGDNITITNGVISVGEGSLTTPGVVKIGGATLQANPSATVAATEAAVSAALTGVSIGDATTTTKGVASFNGTYFTVTSGAVTPKTATNTVAGVVKLGTASMGNAADVAASEAGVAAYVQSISGGLTSVTTGAGLSGLGTSASPLLLDINDYSTTTAKITVSTEFKASGSNGNYIQIDPAVETGGITLNVNPSDGNAVIQAPFIYLTTKSSSGIIYIGNNSSTNQGHIQLSVNSLTGLKLKIGNGNPASANTAGGIAVVGSDGKLPSSIVPASGTSYTKMTIQQSTFATTDSTYGGKYYELNGICDVIITDADGYEVKFDIKHNYSTTKTLVYIPDSLAANTISNWTMIYGSRTIAS